MFGVRAQTLQRARLGARDGETLARLLFDLAPPPFSISYLHQIVDMLASQLASTVLKPPAVASMSARDSISIRNTQFDPVHKYTLREVAGPEISIFKRYLSAIPFSFVDLQPSTLGLRSGHGGRRPPLLRV